MTPFFQSALCTSRKRCRYCRLSREYREGIAASFAVPEVDFDCPHGVKAEALPALPPLREMAHSLGGSVTRALRFSLRHGGQNPLATAEAQATRWATCKTCENFLPKNHRCRLCGCRLKQKIQLETDQCPVGKW